VSNAGPLWKQLPEGALKKQLLGAIADRAQLGEHDLLELWGLGQRAPAPGSRPRRSSESPYKRRAYGAGPRHAIKPKTIAMAEHIARAVLRNSQAWELFSNDEHHVLCELQSPHGDLFSWIDSRHHEHGGEPWAVLQLGLEGQPFSELASRLNALDDMQPIGRTLDVEEIGEPDLRRSLRTIQLDAVTEEIAEVAKLPGSDPSRVERLYDLSRRQQALLEAQKPDSKA
jgi:DNA primase